MTARQFAVRLILSVAVFALAAALFAPLIFAGGPLLVVDRRPVRWSHSEVKGGPLNSATVDTAGRVLYRVDSGALGPLTEAQATAIVDRIFRQYTDIPTASIEFVNAGRILDPATNQPVDVTRDNVGQFLSARNPTFQNPIIFDSDGSITGGGGVLGFYTFVQGDAAPAAIREAAVVLNGKPLSDLAITTASFLGVFTHEFGHFAGPLDHAQINGNIAGSGSGSTLPPGFNRAQAFDLYAPFTETMFPWIIDAPPGSQLAGQFEDSGVFIATLDMDTQNALSNLYPSDDYLTSRGSIEGRVVIRTTSGDIEMPGINVVARKFSTGGGFPPALGTQAFPIPPTLDGDGVPSIPTDQAATDSLKFVSSAVTGREFGTGTYRIQGLPPGDYLVQIDQINLNAVGPSGIGPLPVQLKIPVVEFYDGAGESDTDSPGDFAPVTVSAGGVTGNIDIILNGFSSEPLVSAAETEPNENKKKAPRIAIPASITGHAASTDDSILRIQIGPGQTDRIEDLYRFTASRAGTYIFFLESSSGSGDMDMFVFTTGVAKKKTSFDDANLLGASVSAASTELVAIDLSPGTYLIGVSAFQGSQNYRLLVLPPP